MKILSLDKQKQYEAELSRFGRATELLKRPGCTHLGVGPMSKNCVDACLELSDEFDAPIMLIASRRQIECLELGSGYVNNWDTVSFAQYVKARDKKQNIILARDHGGPWQHPIEVEKYADIDDAMESAKLSYLRDIEAGFQILHIDPVISNSNADLNAEWILDKIFKLYEFCENKSRELGREVHFEIGTEEQKQNPLKDIKQLEFVIQSIRKFCDERKFKYPLFLVVQTGTKVMETRNIGKFPSHESEIQAYLEETHIKDFVTLCEKYNLKIKEHNTDYLSDASLSVHPKIGIHAANVAPEFGVAETRALLAILDQNHLIEEKEAFIQMAYDSNKWDKWVIDSSKLSKEEKAIICGHYVFSYDSFKKLKAQCEQKLSIQGVDLNFHLKKAVKDSIFRYLKFFNLIGKALVKT